MTVRRDHWAPTLPPEERAIYDAAWAEKRSCRWCRHWLYDDDDETAEDDRGIGACGVPFWNNGCATMIAPEDYTCAEFSAQAPVVASAAVAGK